MDLVLVYIRMTKFVYIIVDVKRRRRKEKPGRKEKSGNMYGAMFQRWAVSDFGVGVYLGFKSTL